MRVYPKVGRLERELQMVKLSATSLSSIAVLWVKPFVLLVNECLLL